MAADQNPVPPVFITKALDRHSRVTISDSHDDPRSRDVPQDVLFCSVSGENTHSYSAQHSGRQHLRLLVYSHIMSQIAEQLRRGKM